MMERCADIYGHGKDLQKSQKYAAMVHRAPNTLTVIDKKKHGKKRRVISQAFSDNSLKSYESIILQQVRRLCDAMREDSNAQQVPAGSWSPAKDTARLCMLLSPHTRSGLCSGSKTDRNLTGDYFTFDVMSNVIFGVPWSTQIDPTYRFVPEVIEKSNVRVGALSQAPELAFLRLDKYLFPEAIRARDRFIDFVEEMLRQGTQAAAKTGKGAFAVLSKTTDPETGLPLRMKELIGESATLIVAGKKAKIKDEDYLLTGSFANRH